MRRMNVYGFGNYIFELEKSGAVTDRVSRNWRRRQVIHIRVWSVIQVKEIKTIRKATDICSYQNASLAQIIV